MTADSAYDRDGVSVPPSRLGEALRRQAASSPDHPALVDQGRSWSYRALFSAVDEARNWLAAKGVHAGDRVVVVNENCAAAVMLLLALTDMDAWPVPVVARLSEREIAQVQTLSDSRCVIYTIEASMQAKLHADRAGATHEEISGIGRIALSAVNGAAHAMPVDPDPAKQVAILVSTSGSTGRPKGVMLSHGNLLYIARVSAKLRQLGPADRFYAVLPISSIVGFSVVVLGTLLSGGTVCLSSRFNPAQLAHALAEEGITVLLGVPAMYALMAQYAETSGLTSLPCPCLRAMGSCGAPLDPVVKEAAERLFGLTLHNGYGLTECSPTVAQTRLKEPRRDCSVGPLFPGVEARMVGKDGQKVRNGEVGELHVRSPGVMLGYFMAPEETARAIDGEGWLNTRDLARFEGGNLFIVGRTTELIVRFGFNVYPAEIEMVLNTHPMVARSAVIGQRIAGDEQILAFVKPRAESTLSIEDLASFAAGRLAPYKRPNQIILMDELPETPLGKVRKAELARLQRTHEELVG
ncbi:MAG TPA: AMP-binding protein [Acetobacteraceae bacterium]|nr:AMP-binding protein [Acetobacteraceae bacterium]